MSFLIEIAVTDYTTTSQAVAGGADRIELCSGLSEGGITPSMGLVAQCRKQFALPLFPIIRPRGGDFLYSDAEFAIMKQDIRLFRDLGCNGVVLGLLQPDGAVDYERTARLVDIAYPMEVTFHRAFDRCRDPFQAMEIIIKAGCQRVLTSGQKPKVTEGLDLVRQLVAEAAGRIIILPGSGVRPDNVAMIARQTGALEFHASLRSFQQSPMEFIHPHFAGDAESYANPYIDPEAVKLLRRNLEGIFGAQADAGQQVGFDS